MTEGPPRGVICSKSFCWSGALKIRCTAVVSRSCRVMPSKSPAALALIPPGQMKMNAAETHVAVMAWQGLEIFSLTGAPPAAPEAPKAEAAKGEAAEQPAPTQPAAEEAAPVEAVEEAKPAEAEAVLPEEAKPAEAEAAPAEEAKPAEAEAAPAEEAKPAEAETPAPA